MSASEIFIHAFLFVSLYFELFLLLAFLEKGREEPPAEPLRYFPNVTIIVPCFNEEKTARATINSLLALDYDPSKTEIIIVDDGSADDTWNVLQEFARNPRVRLFRKENGGKHTALNLGISMATGEIIGCLDADSVAAPDALTEIVRAFEKDPALMAVTPAIKTNKPAGVIQRIQNAEYALSIFFRRALALINGNIVTPGPFSFFKREVFGKIGFYREAHNSEDLEIALRMQSHGMRIGNASRARVYTNTPRTIPALLRQRIRWTYGFLRNFMDYRFMVLRPSLGNVSMLVLPAAAISVFSSIFLFFLMLRSAADSVAREFSRVGAVGFTLEAPKFDWFFLNTSSFVFVAVFLMMITLFLILLGRALGGEKPAPTADVFFYLGLYGLIAPLWLIAASWRVIFSKKTNWAAERSRARKM